MAEFSYKKVQDKYFVTNDDTIPLEYKVKNLDDCVNFNTISEGTIAVGETKEFKFSKDGEYLICINETDTITIKYHLNLQLSIIEGMLNTVCDCSCGCECNDKNELCDLLMLRAKIDVYKRLTNPSGRAFYDAVYQHTKCLVKKPLYCALDQEIILGEAECNKKVVKQLIALDYLAMYFFEIAQAETEEDEEYIRDKFNTKIIFCCIQALGIDVGDIEDLINNNMGLFTINNGAYVNLPPSAVGDFNITVANRAVTVLTLAMFTTSTTPVYSDPEGDVAKEVRIDTLPVDGVLKLSGTNITTGQIIPVAGIVAGNLTYESPNQNALDTDTFNFSVSDLGSGMFVA